ncbi:HK97-gp10 family putative phage morphogenesis protein [Candidatus Enterococcus clewellii]|uniref:HK97 gp10 family phage protein n=1 Tax=Candidatus Enterococcus clewellii TaxID=1834193 RepID=A0A242K363_9ENTE|nr:HK97-gp10 family putative phage morphogenesis protein [Enterococcus sp. 9E7_DIV0242]OTP13436.1 HK97 gp10 family phage protein [Enterococcus sp. 9E7_DIV0242]
MSVSVRWIGIDKFIRKVRFKSKQVQAEVDAEVMRGAFRIERGAKLRVAVDTGTTKQRIQVRKIKKYKAEILSPTHYSIYLEKGTRKMVAQPFLRPAVDEERPRLYENLNKIVKG